MVKRVCLISPGHVAFNPRLVKEADALSSAGFAVHVIAANNLKHLRLLDESILKEAAWSFELVGGGSGAIDFLRRGRTKVAKKLLGFSNSDSLRLHEWAHHSLTELLKTAAQRHRADLYIAHYIAALPAAHAAARQNDSIWGFDAEDYHLGEFEKDKLESIEARAVRKLENAYLPHARHFTGASDGIVAAYAGDYKMLSPNVVLNVFPRANAALGPTKMGRARPGPSIYWFSQTIGTNRGLECAVRAISRARSKPHLYLRGYLQSGIEDKLNDIARPLGAIDRIHYLPAALGADMESLASDHDIGLVAETGYTKNRDIALTNKLFSFLLAGVAVVASDTSAHRAIAEMCDAIVLFSIDSDVALAKVFDDLLLNPTALEKARLKSWTAGQNQFNWDLEQKKIIDAVRAHIGPPIDGYG
jgi:glycosyltransferase involved in cell wall biosynthesis